MDARRQQSNVVARRVSALVALAGWLAAPSAQAAMPVVDVAAIRQLVSQISYWQQQTDAMQRELTQLQQTHAALTGGRGMEQLLPTSLEERNYLPPDWAEMTRVRDGRSVQYGALSDAARAAGEVRTVLDAARLAALPARERERVLEARAASAAAVVTAQRAYAQAGQRFAALQTLVSAIGATPDAKAIADLQGRIAAEQTMLGNEQVRLAALAQAVQAEQWAQAAQLREAAIAGHGQFASRLRPTLP